MMLSINSYWTAMNPSFSARKCRRILQFSMPVHITGRFAPSTSAHLDLSIVLGWLLSVSALPSIAAVRGWIDAAECFFEHIHPQIHLVQALGSCMGKLPVLSVDHKRWPIKVSPAQVFHSMRNARYNEVRFVISSRKIDCFDLKMSVSTKCLLRC